MNWYQRFTQRVTNRIKIIRTRLAQVVAIDVGKPGDGLMIMETAGTRLDKPWHELSAEFKDASQAWEENPLARRLIGLTTVYVVGGTGITLTSEKKRFNKFIDEFIKHPENRLMMRQGPWCTELSLSGELYPTLHTNKADGMSYVRVRPASEIEKITWAANDYESEETYQELPTMIGEPGLIWYHPRAVPDKLKKGDAGYVEGNDGAFPPVMLHYAVNRRVGHVRGSSDLAPILLWLKRYTRWLEGRVVLNAALGVYVWICKVAGKFVKAKEEQYAKGPKSGSVLVVDRDSEEWEAITPSINAADAEPDGRAIRKMIVAGGMGTSLLDIGEPETGNRASAVAIGEPRRRFLRERQYYFGYILADIVVHAWNRAIDLGIKGKASKVTLADVQIELPDVAPEDNLTLTRAAKAITESLEKLQAMVGPSEGLRKVIVRLFFKFIGETPSKQEFEEITRTGAFAEEELPEEEVPEEEGEGE